VGFLNQPEHRDDEPRYIAFLPQPQILEGVELVALTTHIGKIGDVDTEICDVLWIGWDGDVAYRRALGGIRKDVWESWNPESTTITLA